MKKREKPNLFKYATSELSQDAIICYILEWAKIENKEKNEKLHNLSISFIDSLFEKFIDIKKPLKYEKIEIKKQYKNIDVLCIINDKYSIIIEDKTNTKNHSDQLKKYFDKVKLDFSDTEILPIYFKTGDQSNYNEVIINNYKLYLRKDFLKVLNSYNDINNDILDDYKDYLQNIDDSIKSYQIQPINKWENSSWKGFFIELKEKLNDGNWGYVSNPSGGFLGFWWNYDNNDEYYIHLQIDHKKKKITFKLSTTTKVKIEKSIIEKWKKSIAYNENGLIIKKPKVVRVGKGGTIGILENEFRMTDDNGIINMDKTIDFIHIIEKIKLEKFESI
jgi:hypothetical protein